MFSTKRSGQFHGVLFRCTCNFWVWAWDRSRLLRGQAGIEDETLCPFAAVSCSRRALLSTVAACIVQFSPPWIVFLYVVDLIGQLASGGKRSQMGRALTRNRSFSLTSG